MDFNYIIEEINRNLNPRPDEFWAKKTDEFFNRNTSAKRRTEIIEQAEKYISHPSYNFYAPEGVRVCLVEGFFFIINDAQLLADGFMYAGNYIDTLSKRKIIVLSSILFTNDNLLRFFVAHEIGHCIMDKNLLINTTPKLVCRWHKFKREVLDVFGQIPSEEYAADKIACSMIGKVDTLSALLLCLSHFKYDRELSLRVAKLVYY